MPRQRAAIDPPIDRIPRDSEVLADAFDRDTIGSAAFEMVSSCAREQDAAGGLWQ